MAHRRKRRVHEDKFTNISREIVEMHASRHGARRVGSWAEREVRFRFHTKIQAWAFARRLFDTQAAQAEVVEGDPKNTVVVRPL